MPDYTDLSPEELEKELMNAKINMQDAENERRFLGMQSGQHIKVADFERVDRDIEKYKKRVEQLTEQLED